MKKTTTLMMLIIILTSLLANGQGFSPDVESRLQKIIDSFQYNPANPFIGGMSVAIKVDELAEWQGATGFAARNIDAQNNLLPGGTPFNVNTLSRIYSVTKTFTAVLMLELEKQGALNLDDPITKYLPLLHAVNPGINISVTIRQLLAHESGYSDYTGEQALQIAVAFNPMHIWTPYEMISFVHQLNAPGSVRSYSSTNYILLGAIIEAATGRPVEQLFRQRFFDPLHLTSMYLGGRENLEHGGVLASPHDNISPFNPIFQFTGQPTFPDTTTNISRFPLDAIVSLAFTGGGIVSNIGDLAEWGNALFGGKGTSKATLEQMLRSISSTPDEDGDYLGYGLIRTTKISAIDVFIGHDGNAPGYRSIMYYQPERKLTIAILTNYHDAKLYDVAKALYEALPEFLCGNENRKEDKIQVCLKGKEICIAKAAAPGFMEKGAYLGVCDEGSKKHVKENHGKQQKKPEGVNTITASPNPFTGQVTLSFKANESGSVKLSIYDLNGRFVKNVYNAVSQKNINQKINFDGSSLPAGIYICRLQTSSGIAEQRLVRSR